MSHAFSAPGKALVAGGYLVLDPAYNAYVTALSSRMHAVIDTSTSSTSSTDPTDPTSTTSTVSVRSPQFGGLWDYLVAADGTVTEKNGRHNPFLAAAIRFAAAYAFPPSATATCAPTPATPPSATITLFSDPGYHTRDNTTPHSAAKTFLYHHSPIEHVPKTGMGLSAGLVTVVTAALMWHWAPQPWPQLRRAVHNLAQVAHCDAQGKIGSGFDVAAACYGSIVYRRFAPDSIAHLLAQTPSADFSAALRAVVDSDWDFSHLQCALPPGVRLLMGDVKGGSETPRLVSKVLLWRAADPSSAEVYAQLDSANEALMAAMTALHALYAKDKEAYWLQFQRNLRPLAQALAAIRTGLQRLTAASGAEIEPEAQTVLLDRCLALPGCLGGVVPGAGGYDAVCLLVEALRLEELLQDARAKLGSVTWLDLSEEAEGLREEDAGDYAGLPQ